MLIQGQKHLVLQLSQSVWNWCIENQIYLLIQSLLGSLYLFAVALPPYSSRVSEIWWDDTLLQSSGWVWLRPWTCSLFCGCICCCRHLWCRWLQQFSSPKGNINDLDADWSYLGIKNCCWGLYRHFCLQICSQNFGTMCHSHFAAVDAAPDLAVAVFKQPMFSDDFPRCLWLVRGPKQLLSRCKFCGL